MGLFEKRRARKFFIYVQDFEENDPKSHEGLDLSKVTAREVISYVPFTFLLHENLKFSCIHRYNCIISLLLSLSLSFSFGSKYGLEDDTIDFIGHALALHIDDSYLDKPAMDFVKRMKVQLFLHHLPSDSLYKRLF